MSDGMFTVLTSFHFDVAEAVADSKTLQEEVGKISTAADSAMLSLKQLSVGFLSHIGLGTGGFIGMVYNAISAVDRFDKTQRQMAQSFMANGVFSGDDAFPNAMIAANKAMENMNETAQKFNLPVDDLVRLSSVLGNSLMMQGADRSDLSKSTGLAASFMRAAPVLGINEGQGTGELLEMISGRIHPHSRTFNRLAQGNPALQKFAGLPGVGGGMTSHGMLAWQALAASERVKLLSDALKRFQGDAKAIKAETESFSAQLRRLKDSLMGTFSILRPIGRAFIEPLKLILLYVNQWISGPGKEIMQRFGKILQEFLKDPIALYERLTQLSRLKHDFNEAKHLVFLSWAIGMAIKALKFFGIEIGSGLLWKGLSMLGGGLKWIGGMFLEADTWLWIFKALNYVFEEAMVPLAVFTSYLQAFSLGMAKAHTINLKWVADHLAKISELMDRLMNAMAMAAVPFNIFLDTFSDIFAWIFRLDVSGDILLSLFEGLVEAMELVGKSILSVFALVNGAVGAITQAIIDLSNGNFLGIPKRMKEAYDEDFEGFLKKYGKKFIPDWQNQNVSENKITVNGGIHINNDFKEQMEPDRIAFTLKEQLVKAATNPSQAAGRSLRSGYVTAGG